MTYAIGYIIYGLDATLREDPFTQAFIQDVRTNPRNYADIFNLTEEEMLDPDTFYIDDVEDSDLAEVFTEAMDLWTTYRGDDPVPVAFGVELGQFDETESLTLAELNDRAQLNHQQARAEYQHKLQQLPESLQKLLPKPQIIIVWGSS